MIKFSKIFMARGFIGNKVRFMKEKYIFVGKEKRFSYFVRLDKVLKKFLM